jgi:hypothetical protein
LEDQVINPSADGQPESPKKPVGEAEAISLGFVLAVVYGAGLVTSNLFLSKWGLSDISLIKPKAIFTGAIVLGSLATLAAGPIYVTALLLDWKKTKNTKSLPRFYVESLAAILCPLILTVAFGWLIQDIDSPSDFRHFGLPPGTWLQLGASVKFGLGLYISSVVACAMTVRSARTLRSVLASNSFAGIAKRLARLSIDLSCALAGLILYMNLFATKVYPLIPQGLGGGRPERLQFVVQASEKQDLMNLGIQFMGKDQSITTPLWVLYETDDFFGVVADHIDITSNSGGSYKEVAINLDKKLVKGSFVSDELYP